MKKFTFVLSLALAMMLCICACACAENVQRQRNVNMENALTDMTMHAEFTDNDVTDTDLTAVVYDEVSYDIVDIGQLKVGDTIETAEGDTTVETLENDGSAILINGGTEANGVTLYPEDENNRYVEMDYEMPAMIPVGQAQLQFAEAVKINVYKMDEDLSPAGEGYETYELAGTEAGAKLKEIAEKFGGSLSPYATTVTIGSEEGVITEVTVDYVP